MAELIVKIILFAWFAFGAITFLVACVVKKKDGSTVLTFLNDGLESSPAFAGSNKDLIRPLLIITSMTIFILIWPFLFIKRRKKNEK